MPTDLNSEQAKVHLRHLAAMKTQVIYVAAWGPADKWGVYSRFEVEAVRPGVQAHLMDPVPEAHMYVGWRNVSRALEAVEMSTFDNLDGEMDYD